jgi:uncharacterized membrane protein (UPF0127 family)
MSFDKRYKTLRPPRHSGSASLNWHRCLLACAAALLLAVLAPGSVWADPLLTYPLRVGEHSIRAEVANTAETRRKGLMFRTRLAESSGMVFIFPREQRISMWMKNTPIALSVAFIDVQGRILNIEEMQPHSEQSHSSAGPAKYALEMNQGWFRKRGIGPGDRIIGLERLPGPE